MYEGNLEKKEYPNLNLTPKEKQILIDLESILKIKKDSDAVSIYEKRHPKIQDFRIEIMKKFRPTKEDFKLAQYLLWHKFIGSTPPENIDKFDIPFTEEDEKEEKLKDIKDQSSGYIERFIRNDIKKLI